MSRIPTSTIGVLALTFISGCGVRAETPCDAIGARRSVITPSEYQVCAKEMMTEVDALRPQVRTFVRRDPGVRAEALESSRRLQLLLQRSGIERDAWSAGRMEERWPDHRLREFNSAIWQANFAYHTALEVGENIPAGYNEEYLDKALTSHDLARSIYNALW